ncbi:MAG: ribonuclease P protein component [Bacilli bacterium]|nr:ribonuclease P protein component [Bacilli bacterium]
MKKENRLLSNDDFKRVIDKKNSFSNSSFVFYYLQNSLNKIRVGISCSSRIGNAVVRNKIKRQVRMMCNTNFDKTCSFDFVIIIRQGYKNKNFAQNKDELNYLYTKFKRKEII